MQIRSAVLIVSLVVAHGCLSLPKRGDSIRNTIGNMINIAQTTLVRISVLRAKFALSQQTEISVPSINGLTNISYNLALLYHELKSPDSLIQIQTDVSSLKEMVCSLIVTMNCTVNATPGREVGNDLFPDSRPYTTLAKLQGYLNKFLLNKEKLKVC